MTRVKNFTSNSSFRIVSVVVLIIAFCGVASYTLFAETSVKVERIEMPGADGEANNALVVFDRYVIVTPFAPSKSPSEDAPLSEYDNHYVQLIDTKKPDSEVLRADLGNCYFPSKVIYDPAIGNLYVRGIQYSEEWDGSLRANDVIAQMQLNLDDNGKPIFGSVVSIIRIPGRGTPSSSDAPNEFVMARKGDYLLFSNSASLFSFNVVTGFLHEYPFVDQTKYELGTRISFFDVDVPSDTLSVSITSKEDLGNGVFQYSSEIKFYRFEANATITSLKEVNSDGFPKGLSMAPGSNLAVSSDSETGVADFAYLLANDGSICQVDLRGESLSGTVKVIQTFPDLAVTDPENSSPRIIGYDSARRMVTAVKRGYRTEIVRPLNDRPGALRRIVRPLNITRATEPPSLVMARLNRKGKLISSNVYSGGLEEEYGLSNFVTDGVSTGYIATYTGKLFMISIAGGNEQADLVMIGDLGPRVNRIEFNPVRLNVITINSLGWDEENSTVTSPGSVVLGKVKGDSAQSSASGVLLAPYNALIRGGIGAISKPCNIK